MNTSYRITLYLLVACIINQSCSQSATENVIDDPNVHKDTVNEDEQKLLERDQGFASNTIGDPEEYVDAKIYELQGKLPGLITSAKKEIEDKLRFTLFKKNTQGWAIVGAGVKDIWGNYVSNDYLLKDTTQLYLYGFLFFYGLGFGLPALVGNPPLPPIGCGLGDYQAKVEEYGLSYGSTHLSSQFGVKTARSLISEFDTWVRLDLACILDEEDNCQSAAEVKWTLDNLIAAYNARLDLEEERYKRSSPHGYHDYHPTNSV